MGSARKLKNSPAITGKLYVRKQPRFHCDLELQVRVPGFAEFVPVTMKNISMGGMFCEVPEDSLPAAGNVLEFRIEGKNTPGAASEVVDEMVGLGIIKWTRPRDLKSQHSGIGIEFKTLPIETARFIKQAIEKARKK